MRRSVAMLDKAILYVGLNVGNVPRWTPEQVMEQTTAERAKLGLDVSASYVPQRGVWASPTGQVVTEGAVQVVFLNTGGAFLDFEQGVLKTAEGLCSRLKQEAILVEVGRRMWTVSAEPAEAETAEVA